jgi:hypothetical protein
MFSLLLLVVCLLLAPSAFAVVFEQCYKDIRANKTGQTGGVDSVGNPVPNITDAVGITYERCIEWCSSAPETLTSRRFRESSLHGCCRGLRSYHNCRSTVQIAKKMIFCQWCLQLALPHSLATLSHSQRQTHDGFTSV